MFQQLHSLSSKLCVPQRRRARLRLRFVALIWENSSHPEDGLGFFDVTKWRVPSVRVGNSQSKVIRIRAINIHTR